MDEKYGDGIGNTTGGAALSSQFLKHTVHQCRVKASPAVCSLSLSPSQFLILENGDGEHIAHQLSYIYHLQSRSSQLPLLRCKSEITLLLYIITIPTSQQLETCEKASTFRRKQGWGLPNLSSPYRTQYGELGPLVPKFLGKGNIGGGFLP